MTPGPLGGVPVTIKVNVDQAGYATTNGVAAFKDIIAPGDAPVAANLKRAGAIPVGRTNTPEFSFRATTDNELYGRTMNPWNDWASAGGSSGGAAAAAMMGFGPIHHGNDIGGSLRFPSLRLRCRQREAGPRPRGSLQSLPDRRTRIAGATHVRPGRHRARGARRAPGP